ncbi:NAD(P)-dependent alcohol dehydrogenase [Sulfurovum sp. CS9]|jgi:NADPH:quinone reductase-like Zn-dependent oxidoreductase|uniref:NAD(P)-dependent alcohol dehydrogenase n=1 Tax=Sulfurovum sp. CS9 TaxID=3391146 RepID=UPI0039EB8818
MKAIVYTKYGLPDVLHLEEVEKPTPKDDEVLVKVHAASINDWDWQLLQGIPFVNRLMAGLLKPTKIRILGCDIAGRVEAVGKNVKQFRADDEVFGDLSGCGFGGFAEYVCARENTLALKLEVMTFEDAAAIPQAGLLALQGLRVKGEIKPGQKILINGASGGAGTFAVQIAKSFGAEVTGVCSTKKMDFVRSVGADHVIDYTQEDFTKNGQHYDLILDMQAHHSIFDCKRALTPKGVYVFIGGTDARAFQAIFLGPLISMIGNKKMGLLLHKPNKGLAFMKELLEAGKVVPLIDRCYPLSEAAEAMRYFGEGHKKGKVVIIVEHDNAT